MLVEYCRWHWQWELALEAAGSVLRNAAINLQHNLDISVFNDLFEAQPKRLLRAGAAGLGKGLAQTGRGPGSLRGPGAGAVGAAGPEPQVEDSDGFDHAASAAAAQATCHGKPSSEPPGHGPGGPPRVTGLGSSCHRGNLSVRHGVRHIM